MTGSVNNTALTGIRNGFEQLQKNASQIASAGSTSSDTVAGAGAPPLVASLVDLKANVQQVTASMKVLSVSDELIGTLLDIKA